MQLSFFNFNLGIFTIVKHHELLGHVALYKYSTLLLLLLLLLLFAEQSFLSRYPTLPLRRPSFSIPGPVAVQSIPHSFSCRRERQSVEKVFVN